MDGGKKLYKEEFEYTIQTDFVSIKENILVKKYKFINNHNIKVISKFPNIYNKTYQEYILIYSYMEEQYVNE